MRFYDIEVSGQQTRSWNSFPGGQNDPGALNVEFDIPVSTGANPMGQAFVKIWGIDLQDIAQASDFNNSQIIITGGFQTGLPLGDPSQIGTLVQGYIQQAFGNWIGNEMTLEFVIAPGPGPKGTKPNITHNYKAGDDFKDSIKNTLSTAYPGVPVDVNIKDGITANYDQPGIYQTVGQFASYIKNITRDIVGGTYNGVEMLFANNKISVFDNTKDSQSGPKQINFQDLIGQPTWIDSPLISLKVQMRGDIQVGDQILMPQTIFNNTVGASSQNINQSATFQGTFQVQSVHHYGSFRQPDGNSWCTVIEAAPMNVKTPTQ